MPVTLTVAANETSFESFNSHSAAWNIFWLIATVKLTQTTGYYCWMVVCAKGGCKGVVIGDPLVKLKLAFGWGKGWHR